MYTTTTIINKADIPNASVSLLMNLYTQELEYQDITEIVCESNTISFSNNPEKLIFNSRFSKFSNFFAGKITIEENTREYIVSFQADMSRLLIKTGMFAAIVCLVFFLFSAFNIAIFLFSLLIFIVFSASAYGLTVWTFPGYFIRLKYDIEDLLYNEMREAA